MPVKIQFEFNANDKARLAAALNTLAGREQYRQIMNRGILRLKVDTINKTPKKTGLARRSFYTTEVGEYGRMLYNKIPYVKGLEEGTAPHEIRPKNKKALAWEVKPGSKGHGFAKEFIRTKNKLTGAPLKNAKSQFIVFAKKVMHPGTRPYNMIKNSLRATRDQIQNEIKEFVRRSWA